MSQQLLWMMVSLVLLFESMSMTIIGNNVTFRCRLHASRSQIQLRKFQIVLNTTFV